MFGGGGELLAFGARPHPRLQFGLFFPHSQGGPDRVLEVLKQGAEAIPSIWGVPVPTAVRARLVRNDVEALIALRTKGLQSPGFAAVLPTMTMPCLLFAGEHDPVCAENR